MASGKTGTKRERSADEDYMRQALELAMKGLGRTSPNPVVGCVIVKAKRVVGQGWHKKAGGPHAEIFALKAAGKEARGATLYVTLEPCCHHGKTGPCTKAIIDAGVKRIVYAMKDPNKLVCGKGHKELVGAGIETKCGVLEKEARELNEFFIKYMTTGLPFVIAKAALSADGKLADKDGNSKWISNEKSRQIAHGLRNRVDAVMVGANTVIRDDPLLTCRIPNARNPQRIIVDAKLRIPLNAKVFNKEAETIVATSKNAPKAKVAALKKKGVTVILADEKKDKIDLRKLMKKLSSMGITSVMIEGGGHVLGSAFESGIVDKVVFFIAPKIIGEGIGIVSGGKGDIMAEIELRDERSTRVGSDLMIEGYIRKD